MVYSLCWQPGFLSPHKPGNKTQRRNWRTKILAVVGDKIVMQSDIDNSIIDMIRQGVEVPKMRCRLLDQAMGNQALVLQAEKRLFAR